MAGTTTETLRTATQRAGLIAVSAAALIGVVLTWIFMALHIYSLRSNPGATLDLAGLGERDLERLLPPEMDYQYASAMVEVDIVVRDGEHGFLGWQIAAWVSRYGLAILFLFSVIYLCWCLWRRSGVLGWKTPWWAAGLAALSLVVAFFAPWALIRAQQLVAQAVGAPTRVQGNEERWFVIPGWALEEADWWLVLFSAVLAVLALVMNRARRAGREPAGPI
ncbi:hypothetical protein [uncultured Serinicoccus sp.]|uniref:hypothetical protein n=1 Tax=uncultured Serinicoccus sp. TaxID=735514 RepID=UPI002630B4FF|nr:hypothetical protein [uncultured Serinicoccus sp.]